MSAEGYNNEQDERKRWRKRKSGAERVEVVEFSQIAFYKEDF